ncbi:FR47-like protein [Parapedobacter composti]|uniref:FR47-like protein n=1 Tax=Parapedobacter composti TaxID=623281 RepID=A0A1I1MDW3_9SPHI|nr:GNAT family N-acetyltransferase [Parapedobacter composti]SFC83549.1 FR47-like protein [Parapedobacter composti]
MEVEKLNNPTWYSLTETHKDFGIDYNGTKFYCPSYCPFGGFIIPDTTQSAIDTYAMLTNNFYVVGDKPNFNSTVRLNKELVCNQMLLDKGIEIEICEHITELRTTKQMVDLFYLVNLVQPGYFKTKTAGLGSYYGIYKNEKLIAVTGERMKMNKYTEVSSVVTHPEHTGKGYAKQLLAYTSNKIIDEQKNPYLHVADTNIGAKLLYEKLGFRTRRKISFWNFVTNDNRKTTNR